MKDIFTRMNESTNASIAMSQALRRFCASTRAKRVSNAAQLVASTFKDKSNVAVGVAGTTAYLNVTLKELSGLKDPALIAALEALNNETPDSVDTTDYPDMNERTFIFYFGATDERTGYYCSIRIAVEARFQADSATCKKVVVGYTDPKPTPIYKLECSE